MFQFYFFENPPNNRNNSCSPYTIVNNQLKRYAIARCGTPFYSNCLIQSLCNCGPSGGAPAPTFNSNNTTCPFIYTSPTVTTVPTAYQISIYGKNTTSFNNGLPKVTLEVECTGLFIGLFPGTKYLTTTDPPFGSAQVNDVNIFTGISTTNNPPYTTIGNPNPLALAFNIAEYTNPYIPQGYRGVCKMIVNGQTTNLINEGLNEAVWTWDASNGTWFAQMILQGQTTLVDNAYNVKGEINFTLNADTNSDKGQTWLQMNGKVSFSSSPACPGCEGEATVPGYITNIVNFPLT